MKAFCRILVFLLSVLSFGAESSAQELPEGFILGEVLQEAQCFNLVNEAPYGVYGSIITNAYITEGGVKAHHRSNFTLKEGAQREFCTFGPFFEGRKVELTLRTLVPVFSCQTAITSDVVIKGKRKPEGGADTWAECL